MVLNGIKLVVFDLDGTLVDAYAAITASFNYAMRRLNYPEQPAGVIRRAVGWGDKSLLRPFVKAKDLTRALAVYRRHHAGSLVEHSRFLPGAKVILSRLKSGGYRLAVASNRPTRFSRILIRHLGMEKYFDYILCGDKLKQGKPHPEILVRIMKKLAVTSSQTLYVGDMAIDAKAGRRAGVKTVIVTTGSSHKGEVAREKPYRIVSSLAKLGAFL